MLCEKVEHAPSLPLSLCLPLSPPPLPLPLPLGGHVMEEGGDEAHGVDADKQTHSHVASPGLHELSEAFRSFGNGGVLLLNLRP